MKFAEFLFDFIWISFQSIGNVTRTKVGALALGGKSEAGVKLDWNFKIGENHLWLPFGTPSTRSEMGLKTRRNVRSNRALPRATRFFLLLSSVVANVYDSD